MIAYRRAGCGPPVVLLHGWPTSSHLWRHTIRSVADTGRLVIAPDVPGFGASDKPAGAPYTLDWQTRMLDGLLTELGIERAALVVHDLGGPIGLLWATRHPDRVERLVVLDTILFPRKLPLVRALLQLVKMPGVGSVCVRPAGLRVLLRLGVVRRSAMREEVRHPYLAPFATRQDQRVLRRALTAPGFDEFDRLAVGLEALAATPTLIVWGDRDLLLPRAEMQRIAKALPQAETTTIPGAGHFLQEDQPDQVAAAIAAFLARAAPEHRPDATRGGNLS